MASIEARGYVNKPETKTSGGGKTYHRFTLAVKQKRKDKAGQEVQERIYLNCVDFSGGDCPKDSDYIGVTGYLTVTGWCKDGKGGANLDVTVKEYDKTVSTLPPREGSGGSAAAAAGATPPDPWELTPEKP